MVITKLFRHGLSLRLSCGCSYRPQRLPPYHWARPIGNSASLAKSTQSDSAAHAHNSAQNAKKRVRQRRRRGLAFITSLFSVGLYVYDRQYKHSTLTRNLRAISTFTVVAVDTKVQRLLGDYGDEKRMRERSAERFIEMFESNGGIYQKIGQGIALQSTTMSPELRTKFAKFYDDCPSVSLIEIAEVLREDFDLPSTASPEEVFDSLFLQGSFESKPVGSASIAQVHKARLKDTGEAVAVKVQKPAIQQQISWDLWVFAYAVDSLRLLISYGII